MFDLRLFEGFGGQQFDHCPDVSFEDPWSHAFMHELRCARGNRFLLYGGASGNHNYWHGPFAKSEFANKPGSAHLAHTMVCDQDVRARFEDVCEGILGGGEHGNAAVGVKARQHAMQEKDRVRVVVSKCETVCLHSVISVCSWPRSSGEDAGVTSDQ